MSSKSKIRKISPDLEPLYRLPKTRRGGECSIFMAPSSLKGSPGYGIYTTRNLWKGERVLGRPDGLSIPVEVFNDPLSFPKSQLRKEWIELWNQYWWGRGLPDHVRFEAGPDVVDFQIGLGYLPNHHCELSSLHPEYPEKIPYEDSLANRFESPGAGAFSYHMGRQFVATRYAKAGEELFMSYGYCQHGQGPEWTQDVYMPAEFEVASDILWSRIGPDARETFQYDNWGNIIWKDAVIGKDTPTVKAKLVKELLPETKQQAIALAAAPLTREDLPQYLARTTGVNARTPDWIRENGVCLETMIARKSTLPHAGQGGFAQFSIEKGSIITLAPVLHIMDKDVLELYDVDGFQYKNYDYNYDDDDGNEQEEEEEDGDDEGNPSHDKDDRSDNREKAPPRRTGTQLLINYCFSHPQSTILLCPTTNADLINHCSVRTKQCGRNGPNAAFRWASGWDPTSNEWRKLSLEELAKKQTRGLSLEIYALRDIAPGEEIFMDYGEAWEQAWEKHVQEWKPPPRSSSSSTTTTRTALASNDHWITAKEANEANHKGGLILEELQLLPLGGGGDDGDSDSDSSAKSSSWGNPVVDHPYLMTGCVYWETEMDSSEVFGTVNEHWRTNMTKEQIMEVYADDGSVFEYPNYKGYAGHEDGLHWPCTVWSPQEQEKDYDDETTYVVQIHPRVPMHRGSSYQNHQVPLWARHQLPRVLGNYPRTSIRYFVKMHAGDQYLPGVFRHPIVMSDDQFPDQWKNLSPA